MKKMTIIFSVLLFSLSGIARDLGTAWVVTNEGKMDCSRITIGPLKAHVVLENGDRKVLSANEIISFAVNGKVFYKLPLFEYGKPTNKMVFMELLKTKCDLSLYKYEHANFNKSDLHATLVSYYLYEGNKYYMEVDEKSMQSIFKFFGFSIKYE